jgi:kinesin family protein 4/21/27
MGSGYLSGVAEENLGIIPRVIKQIFSEVNRRKSKADIAIKCAFLEIYNEEIIDLLDHDADKMKPIKKDITIREEKNGAISVYGVKEVLVKTEQEMAGWLDLGSSARSTASTLMNQ